MTLICRWGWREKVGFVTATLALLGIAGCTQKNPLSCITADGPIIVCDVVESDVQVKTLFPNRGNCPRPENSREAMIARLKACKADDAVCRFANGFYDTLYPEYRGAYRFGDRWSTSVDCDNLVEFTVETDAGSFAWSVK